MRRASRASLIVTMLAALTACSRPYATPRVETPDGTPAAFAGLRQHIAQAGGTPLRIVTIHGMCEQTRDKWIMKRVESYAEALGTEFDEDDVPGLPTANYGLLERYDVPIALEEGKAEGVFLLYSPYTNGHKKLLAFDKTVPPGGPRRASLNHQLKTGLLDSCLSDAVVYAGPNGEPIRRGMEEAVCDVLGGRLDGRRACEIPAGRRPQPLVFVTESLGSKVLFDAVRRLRENAGEPTGAAGRAAETRLLDALADTQALYMVSNQVPLLDRADRPVTSAGLAGRAAAATPTEASSLGEFLGAVRAARAGRASRAPLAPWDPGEVLVVNFADPNDLLSWCLVPEALPGGSDKTRLVNVWVSNAPAWFGLVEDPRPGHMGYFDNEAAIGLLVDGHQPPAGAPKPERSLCSTPG